VIQDDERRDVALNGRRCPAFRIGTDGSGRWIALRQDGACGGLFVGRKAAIQFALSQNGHNHTQILLVESPLHFDFGAVSAVPPLLPGDITLQHDSCFADVGA
jgi:hypothetical protein